MLRTFALVTVFLVLILAKDNTTPSPVSSQTPFCNGCQFAVNLVENQLKKFESVTKSDLVVFANKLCDKAPKVEVINTLCTTVKDDLIDVAVQLIESIERQVSGNVTCKVLKLCS